MDKKIILFLSILDKGILYNKFNNIFSEYNKFKGELNNGLS